MNKNISYLAAIITLGFAGFAIWMMVTREKFQPEFLDKRQEATTIAMEDSSYIQRTNHVTPSPYSIGPLHGTESPFQVNQYKAYIP
jgi:hypothetical protein